MPALHAFIVLCMVLALLLAGVAIVQHDSPIVCVTGQHANGAACALLERRQ